ncbi:MAG: hypothetical protein QOF76_339 [Solirubrobacteraceae bacterium]|nr:hypothetical protein [Solirubrobacteraceae bacterium]
MMLRRTTRAPLDRDGLRAEIARLSARRSSTSTDRELVRLRHQLGILELEHAAEAPPFPEPADLPDADGLPEFGPGEITPAILRAAILRDGCALVRGLVPRDAALELAAGVDRAFADRAKATAGGDPSRRVGLYDEFVPDARYPEVDVRPWIAQGGGVLAGDAPRLARQLFAMLEAAGLPRLVEGYLGEPPLVTLEKTTLRKADPSVAGAWHQDGRFMGPVRALNLWLSLSRCGDTAPGLDIVPRRLEQLVAAGGDGTFLDYQVTDATAAEAAAPKAVERPVFEPGDALLFDELFLHQTGSDPAMPNPRFAVESWFFGASAFPDYRAIAV